MEGGLGEQNGSRGGFGCGEHLAVAFAVECRDQEFLGGLSAQSSTKCLDLITRNARLLSKCGLKEAETFGEDGGIGEEGVEVWGFRVVLDGGECCLPCHPRGSSPSVNSGCDAISTKLLGDKEKIGLYWPTQKVGPDLANFVVKCGGLGQGDTTHAKNMLTASSDVGGEEIVSSYFLQAMLAEGGDGSGYGVKPVDGLVQAPVVRAQVGGGRLTVPLDAQVPSEARHGRGCNGVEGGRDGCGAGC